MFKLQENEQIITYVRKHWIWLLVETFKVLMFFFIPVLAVYWLGVSFDFTGLTFFNYPVSRLLDLFVYLWAIFSWGYMADRFTKYALNFWVITNNRIVESEHLQLFSRRLSTMEYDSIEDITVAFNGVVETLLNFGSLTVQTAGTQREFLADDIRDPEGVKQLLFKIKEKNKKEDKTLLIETLEQESNEDGKHFNFPEDQKSIENKIEPDFGFDWSKK